MTAVQRLQVDCLLMAQRGTLGDLVVLGAIREKVAFTTAVREKYLVVKDGLLTIDMAALVGVPSEVFGLENEEARRLLEVLDKWPTFSVADFEWLTPLRRDLTASTGLAARKGK